MKKRKSNSYDPRKSREKIKCEHINTKLLTYGIYCNDCENLHYHSKAIRAWLETLTKEEFEALVKNA